VAGRELQIIEDAYRLPTGKQIVIDFYIPLERFLAGVSAITENVSRPRLRCVSAARLS
jgi:hypothetical protein